MEVHVHAGTDLAPLHIPAASDPAGLRFRILQCCDNLDPNQRYSKVTVGWCSACGTALRPVPIFDPDNNPDGLRTRH